MLSICWFQNDEEGMCGFLTYFIMSGYQFKQAQAVLQKMVGPDKYHSLIPSGTSLTLQKQLKQKLEDLQLTIQGLTGHTAAVVKQWVMKIKFVSNECCHQALIDHPKEGAAVMFVQYEYHYDTHFLPCYGY